MSTNSVAMLDRHYAAELGCAPEDFGTGALLVVESDVSRIRFGKGVPLAVFGLDKPTGAVLAVRPGLGELVRRVVKDSIERRSESREPGTAAPRGPRLGGDFRIAHPAVLNPIQDSNSAEHVSIFMHSGEAEGFILDSLASEAIKRAVGSVVDVAFWFHGRRLFCEPQSFVDRELGTVRSVDRRRRARRCFSPQVGWGSLWATRRGPRRRLGRG